MRREATLGALLLITVGIILGATVFRSDIAQATGLAQSVTVTNTAINPVPVQQQGTASVNVTNTSLAVHNQATTQLLVSGELSSGASTLASNLDVSSYREIRLAPGFVACAPSGGEIFLILEATEGAQNYTVDDINVCAGPDAALHNLVYDVPGRTLTIRCVCGSGSAMSLGGLRAERLSPNVRASAAAGFTAGRRPCSQ